MLAARSSRAAKSLIRRSLRLVLESISTSSGETQQPGGSPLENFFAAPAGQDVDISEHRRLQAALIQIALQARGTCANRSRAA